MFYLKTTLVLLLSFLIATITNAAPVHIPLERDNVGTLNFNLELPNKDTVEIGLSFKLLTTTVESDPDDNLLTTITTVESDDDSITTLKTTTPAMKLDDNFVSVEEAIEGFRRDLIKKEMEISGIIESNHIFHRHFMLEFSDSIKLAIRCTYDSDYEKRSLHISCYEYHEYETERILSNGEVETIRRHDPDYKTAVEILDLKSMKQTYKMDIF